jgi:hypothetical protein
MRRRHYFTKGYRGARHPDELVADLHDVIEGVMERAMDAAFKFSAYVPWSAEDITRHVDDFVNRHVADVERCVEDTWDDKR